MTEQTSPQSSAEEAIRSSYASLAPHLNERSVRIWAATEVRRYGRGGMSAVHRSTNLDFKTIRRGIKDLAEDTSAMDGRVRRKGGGRKSLAQQRPEISQALSRMIDGATRGDPESLLLWTNKSTYTLKEALKKEGYDVSQTTIYKMLVALDYSLQSNKKKLEGSQNVDRDAQFQHINERGQYFQSQGCPVLSVDTKKKENIGNYKNGGREYSPTGKPVAVKTHDFPNKILGKVAPYGIYDIGVMKVG